MVHEVCNRINPKGEPGMFKCDLCGAEGPSNFLLRDTCPLRPDTGEQSDDVLSRML